ncbi:putative integral membrane protein [Rhodococcus phage E3]|uniref:putative integral membrane protein n=1 Tax=Rhodococcus phage E3 TaxID=1007869 RepID=UPI0002C6A477|nr:putative integral membrane protein [Rhodococcus phage E3]AEQ20963.1 putative integral membrane protein [Rhodococcus phage E3]
MAKRKREIDPVDHGWPLQFGLFGGAYCWGFALYALILGIFAGDDDDFFLTFARWCMGIGTVLCVLALIYGAWLLWVTRPWKKEDI